MAGEGWKPSPSMRSGRGGHAHRARHRMRQVVEHPVGERLLVVEELDRQLHPGGRHAVGIEHGLPLRGGAARDQRLHPGTEGLVVPGLRGEVGEGTRVGLVGEAEGAHERALEAGAHARHRERRVLGGERAVVHARHARGAHVGRDRRLLDVGRAAGAQRGEGAEEVAVRGAVGGLHAHHRVVLQRERGHEEGDVRPRRRGRCARGGAARRRHRRRASSRTCSRRAADRSPPGGRPARRPPAAMRPLRAWTTMSMPASIASGPAWPNAVTLPTTIRGWRAARLA